MALDLAKWKEGDDIRLLIALGLALTPYTIGQIQKDMNYLGENMISAVDPVLDLVDEFEAAQAKLKELNNSSEGKVLTKADVLEWTLSGANSYSPEREMERIRTYLWRYFGFSEMAPSGMSDSGGTMLLRS